MTFDEEDKRALEAVVRSPEGRHFLRWVLKQCPVYSTSYDEATGSVSAFAEGNRNVALKLIRVLELIDPRLYPTLLIENVEAEEAAASIEQEQEHDDGE
jgi:hypothetical protein